MQKPDLLTVMHKEDGYVYHWFNNSASQHGDFNMQVVQMEGWEAVLKEDTPTDVLNRVGQSTDNPSGGVVSRGDLVLYRMRREMWEKNVHSETVARRKRMETTIDTMVAQSQENAAKALRDRGQTRIPGNLVFREEIGDPV